MLFTSDVLRLLVRYTDCFFHQYQIAILPTVCKQRIYLVYLRLHFGILHCHIVGYMLSAPNLAHPKQEIDTEPSVLTDNSLTKHTNGLSVIITILSKFTWNAYSSFLTQLYEIWLQFFSSISLSSAFTTCRVLRKIFPLCNWISMLHNADRPFWQHKCYGNLRTNGLSA